MLPAIFGGGVTVRGFGDLEAAIMDQLWTRGSAMTVREVLDSLQPHRPLAYNTVLTVMDNLYKKKWLHRKLYGRAFRFTPAMSREEYGARELRQALDDAGNPANTLMRFVERMSVDETAALRQALAAYEQDNRQ
jgi:predicted transcriptional regulator